MKTLSRMLRWFQRGILALRLVLLFARVEISLRREPLPSTCRRFGISLATDPPPASLSREVAWRSASRVRAVSRVAPWWPFGDTCLRRCLVVGSLLGDDGPTLHLGVRRRSDGAITAHSWIVIAGQTLDPSADDYHELPLG